MVLTFCLEEVNFNFMKILENVGCGMTFSFILNINANINRKLIFLLGNVLISFYEIWFINKKINIVCLNRTVLIVLVNLFYRWHFFFLSLFFGGSWGGEVNF